VVSRAIIGLGNPGPRYAGTRHNAGFLVLDRLARRHGVAFRTARGIASWGDGRIAGVAVRLVEPLGYMNRSGEALAELFPDDLAADRDLLVVHDELDLPFGTVRLKRSGGTAGHRGLESIVEHLGGPGFCRLRVGIGRPVGQEVADYVLSPFPIEERERLEAVVDDAADACEAWLELGVEAAMNRVNARSRPPRSQGQDADAAADAIDPRRPS
jgi:PTH1 family peptidyl-tRNA hydrolase